MKTKNCKAIMLVEDDVDDQEFFIEALCGIENTSIYAVVRNGQEALERLKNEEAFPDLIFMDINMPRMNGIECLVEIVKNPETKDIPVIILSTSTSQVEMARSIGARGFLEKPRDQRMLISYLKKMIDADFNNGYISSNRNFANHIKTSFITCGN